MVNKASSKPFALFFLTCENGISHNALLLLLTLKPFDLVFQKMKYIHAQLIA